MKVYDNDWFLRFDLHYDDAARLLADWGITFILAQSRYLPMPDTAIRSEVPEHLKDRYAAYDDRLFREALRRVGIQYVATCLVGLDPEAIAADPGLVPVDTEGRPEEKIDWYQGIPPDRTTHIDGKVALVERAAQELRPDGVHLGFMRWPGFWELWLPDVSRADFPDYDYSPRHPESLCRAHGGGGARGIAAGIRAVDRQQRPRRLDRLEVRHRRGGHRTVPQRREGYRSGRRHRAQHPAVSEERFRPGHERGVRAAGSRISSPSSTSSSSCATTRSCGVLRRGSLTLRAKRRSGRQTAPRSARFRQRPCTSTACMRDEAVSRASIRPRFREVVNTVAGSPADGILFFTFTDFLVQVLERDDHSRVDIIKMFRDMREH